MCQRLSRKRTASNAAQFAGLTDRPGKFRECNIADIDRGEESVASDIFHCLIYWHARNIGRWHCLVPRLGSVVGEGAVAEEQRGFVSRQTSDVIWLG